MLSCSQATGAISWRKEGIKYRKNELFIDVVENCNLMVSNKGTILRNDVSGCIMVKCYLSGTPECKFGLNDKLLLDNEAKAKKAANAARRPGSGIEIDDVSFHQCVKLGKFDMDRTISFVPPDGEFQLMSYRITENVNLPFRVLPVVKELGRTRLEVRAGLLSYPWLACCQKARLPESSLARKLACQKACLPCCTSPALMPRLLMPRLLMPRAGSSPTGQRQG